VQDQAKAALAALVVIALQLVFLYQQVLQLLSALVVQETI
jgi:hypothetical protein